MSTEKITKGEIKTFVKEKLSSSQNWALNALLKIFDYQTAEEQDWETTNVYNGVGFTGVDAEILSSMAKQYRKRGFLSEKQMAIVYRKMPKYWNQIVQISDQEKLKLQIAKSLIS